MSDAFAALLWNVLAPPVLTAIAVFGAAALGFVLSAMFKDVKP